MRSPVTMSHSCFAFPRRFQKGCGITDITDSDTNRRLFGQTPFRKFFPFYASDADRSTVKMSAFCNFSVTIKSDIFFFAVVVWLRGLDWFSSHVQTKKNMLISRDLELKEVRFFRGSEDFELFKKNGLSASMFWWSTTISSEFPLQIRLQFKLVSKSYIFFEISFAVCRVFYVTMK